MRRTIAALFIVIALVAAACGSDAAPAPSSTPAAVDVPPACVVDADALESLLAAEGITQSTETLTKLRKGAMAPDFALCDEAGNVVQLSDYRGQPVMIVFWAEWCHFCAIEMPTLQAALGDWPDNLVILTVASRGDAGKNLAHYQEKGYTFPVVFDVDERVADRYLNAGIPQTIFIAPDGTIADAVSGAIHLDKGSCIETLTQFANGKTKDIIVSACR